ncbi:MAG TPA: mycofactocin-coupled SDR family oxidoreductase [Mycobacteriales bacterium]|jgi:SDR family mycofactocin-dependent oxidoreductase|nr:mycofactocin-coupled SDR family oxidoreductase [Mycobacteriales bacterium]
MSDAPRVAIVTGAGRGIGAAAVRALAADGYAVLAVDLCHDLPGLPYSLATEADLQQVVASTDAPDRVAAHVADVRDPRQLAAAVATAESRWGGLDVAVGCAGIIAGGLDQWEVDSDVERAVVDINLHGILNLARGTIPAMLRRPAPRSGRFVAVASAAATQGLAKLTAYCAAKAGVTGAVRALAAELGATGITANSVSPGSTRTAILDESARLYDLDDAEAFAAQQPLCRLIEPEEVAAAIAFLASPRSSAITGAEVPVDGGFVL